MIEWPWLAIFSSAVAQVYRVTDRTPVAKCFRNPARMLGTRQIALELGMLRANIEDLG